MQGRFTKKAQDVLTRAQEAALKLGNKYVGTEHILLGLTLAQESVAAKALEGQNVTYHQVMEQIARLYQEDIDTRMNNMLAVLEPTLVIALSLIVGVILLSVMFPLMGIMSSI